MSYQYIKMTLQPRRLGRVTNVWRVDSLSGNTLGYISWYAPWRGYTFHPAHDTLYSAGCLRDVAAFIDGEMAKRRAAPKLEKRHGV
jgi:hypothetical protein